MNKKNLAIIDSDSLCYMGAKEDTLQQVIEKVDTKIQEILYETKADYYVLLVSKGKYFRHDLSVDKQSKKASYKSNRVYGIQPWVKTVKEYLIAKYDAVWYPQLEADDITAWLMHQELYLYPDNTISSCKISNLDLKINKILVAKDKDLLYSIQGKHLNFSKKLDKNNWGMEWIKTSLDDSLKFKANQLLIGDASDGIEALKGVGPKKAEKLLANWREGPIESYILGIYIEYYKGNTSKAIYEFQKNYRLLHMLTTDEDYIREVGYYPSLPEFQKVIKEVKPETIDF